MNKLTILERQLPLRAYPQKELDDILYDTFFPWLSDLLSLTDEQSAKRLNIALPALKDLCIGMGFPEIKKMFEMYADGKMGIKPLPNYFDRILLGKIVSEYKQRKPKKKEMEQPSPTKEEKKKGMDDAVTRFYLEFKRTKQINGIVSHIYDYLDSQGKLQGHKTKEDWNNYKREVFNRAKKIVKAEEMTKTMADISLRRALKTTITQIESGKFEGLKPQAKKLVLIDYFTNYETVLD